MYSRRLHENYPIHNTERTDGKANKVENGINEQKIFNHHHHHACCDIRSIRFYNRKRCATQHDAITQRESKSNYVGINFIRCCCSNDVTTHWIFKSSPWHKKFIVD